MRDREMRKEICVGKKWETKIGTMKERQGDEEERLCGGKVGDEDRHDEGKAGR
jgi:hypothetical protein